MQSAIHSWAMRHLLARDLVIVCAAGLIYVLSALWVLLVFAHRRQFTVADAIRIVVLGGLALLGSTILTHVVSDPRPYLVTHTQPLIPVSHDNGFPSDHVLLAAALTLSLCWINWRWMPYFLAGTLLVALGRLGVGAHHTLDVIGSMAIAFVALLVALALPLPRTGVLWDVLRQRKTPVQSFER